MAILRSETAGSELALDLLNIFDPTKRTCIRPDWSRQGIGYFLSQKHCSCDSCLPDCCTYGWRITLAGSRLLTSAEQIYAPIEGEAFAVAWGLEQSKYFTQGCNDLLVATDHKPLVKIRARYRGNLTSRTNSAADATSRKPSPANEFAELGSLSLHSEMDAAESSMAASLRHETHCIVAISWERDAHILTAAHSSQI